MFIAKNIISFLVAACFLCGDNCLFSQASFQKALEGQGYYLYDVVANKEGEILAFVTEGPLSNPSHYSIIPLSGQIGIVQGWKVDYDSGFAIGSIKQAAYFGETVCFSHSYFGQVYSTITCFDTQSGESWSKKVGSDGFLSAIFDMNQDKDIVITSSDNFSNKMDFYKIDKNGQVVWQKAIVYEDASTLFDDYLMPFDMKFGGGGNIYLTGFYPKSDTAVINDSFVIKADSNGTIVKSIALKNMAVSKMEVTDDGIYLFDKGFPESLLGFSGAPPNQAVLVKMDFDLNVIWSKEYFADNFPYLNADIVRTNDNGLVISHTTFGAFPAILSEIDENGNILTQKGYPNYSPMVKVLSDGALLLGSRYTFDSIGGTKLQPVIARTDQNGDIDGCVTYPTCLNFSDFGVSIDTLLISIVPIIPPDTVNLIWEPTTFSFSPYCDYPPAPVPTFTFPDTLCQGMTASTTDTYNRLAQYREWHLTGQGLDSTLCDSFDFSFSFQLPGEYYLEQAIWVLGCRYDYERKIIVLPPLSLSISDSLVCPGQPMQVMATASRPAAFTWGNGQPDAILPIAASGTYTITATDGHCSATDSLAVTVVAELLGGVPPFSLPPDTVGCQPYLLLPQSAFSDAFFLDGGNVPAKSFTLTEAGSYGVSMEAFGCRFGETFKYGIDCQVDVYLPNSFSPNGDGINDEFQAFGQHFEAIELVIYDRWGGLLHKGLSWDGGNASQGLYAYKLVYQNLKSGQREARNGEVTLLR